MKLRVISFLSFLVLLGSCVTKFNQELVTPMTNYTITNKNKFPVVIRVEDSVTHETFRLYAAGESKVVVPAEKLERKDGSAAGLFFYWASADNKISSWYRKPFTQTKKETAFSLQRGRTEYNIDIEEMTSANIALRFCVRNMDQSTVWKAVDAFDANGKSLWAGWGPYQRDREIQLNYDMTGSFTHPNTIGSPTIDHFSYTLYGYGDYFHLSSTDYYGVDVTPKEGYVQLRNSNMSNTVVLRTTGTDSVFLCINGEYPYYLMVKQPGVLP